MFVEFFHEKYLWAMDKYVMVLHTLCAAGAPDEKLKSMNCSLTATLWLFSCFLLQSNVFEDSILQKLCKNYSMTLVTCNLLVIVANFTLPSATVPTTSDRLTSSPTAVIAVGIGGTLIFILVTVIVICLKRRYISKKRIAPDPADLHFTW